MNGEIKDANITFKPYIIKKDQIGNDTKNLTNKTYPDWTSSSSWLIQKKPQPIFKEAVGERGRTLQRMSLYIKVGYFKDHKEAMKALENEIALPDSHRKIYKPFKEGSFSERTYGDVSYYRDIKFYGDIHPPGRPAGWELSDQAFLAFSKDRYVVWIKANSVPYKMDFNLVEEIARKIEEKIEAQSK